MTSIIKVDEIQNKAGTSAMTIDTNGVVATPARPAFSAYRASSTSEGVTGDIVFNATRSNVGGHYSTTTGKFTAPVAGLYQFNFVGFGANDTIGNPLAANVNVSARLTNETTGTNLIRSYVQFISTTSYPNLALSGMVSLDANDIVKVVVSNRYVYSDATDQYLTFSGYLVG